ncbi:uncharacterized protein LOC129963950 [Argiope bruennichi]|uniref:Uncharacterized protein n=1 Tax=Argiope bruennichi TaxID=94029 RepID=A0A8T0EY06_ARGBR|nr:uncharacterized protein LOC129963950 [Argiope bruennichi]KAF8783243.1 hypothetical protein HNY73_013434 [Argiope bruennichi]
MVNYLLILAACVAVVAAGGRQLEGDEGEYGRFNNWRKVICEKDEDVHKALDNCLQMEPKLIKDAISDCMTEVLPSSKGDSIEFTHSACKDQSLFKKLDKCFAEYEANAEFKKQLELKEDVKACYANVLKKFDLPQLLPYLNGTAKST